MLKLALCNASLSMQLGRAMQSTVWRVVDEWPVRAKERPVVCAASPRAGSHVMQCAPVP